MGKKKLGKYYGGMILKHKKHGFSIKLLFRHRYSTWVFEVVEGNLPENLRPDIIFDHDLNIFHTYSYDTIRTAFTPITDSPAGRLLYAI